MGGAVMFGMLEAIYGYLVRNLGQRNEAANSAGSLHSKAKDIKDYLTGTMYPNLSSQVGKAPFASGKTAAYTAGGTNAYSNANVNLINITGPRLILGGFINLMGDVQTNASNYFTITLDNVEIARLTIADIYNNWEKTQTSQRNTVDAAQWNQSYYFKHFWPMMQMNFTNGGGSNDWRNWNFMFPFLLPQIPVATNFKVDFVVPSGSSSRNYANWAFFHTSW
jgi:hypothetical protein